jgi:hypothetical protein
MSSKTYLYNQGALVKIIHFFSLLFISFGLFSSETIAGLTFGEIDQYINNKFEAAIVETYPYPHIVISDVLPEQVYQELVKNWPSESIFDYQGNDLRMRLPVTGGCAEVRNLTDHEKALWTFLGEEIVNHCIKPRLIAKLTPFFHLKFPFLNANDLYKVTNTLECFNSRMDGLNLDRNNFTPFIHVDHAYMLGALLLFFADDRDHEDLGTALYTSKNGIESLDLKHGADETFYVSKMLPYLPNTLVCFLQNPKGWHGLNAIYKNYNRKSYMAELNLKPEFFKKIYGNLSCWSVDYLYGREGSFLNPIHYNGTLKEAAQK